jgi:hypothetical protein
MTTVSLQSLLEAINQKHGLALRLAVRYPRDEQGAYAFVAPQGARLVLKWSAGQAPLERFRRGASTAEVYCPNFFVSLSPRRPPR